MTFENELSNPGSIMPLRLNPNRKLTIRGKTRPDISCLMSLKYVLWAWDNKTPHTGLGTIQQYVTTEVKCNLKYLHSCNLIYMHMLNK